MRTGMNESMDWIVVRVAITHRFAAQGESMPFFSHSHIPDET